MKTDELKERLREQPARQRVAGHSLFTNTIPNAKLEMDDVATMLGQWWHPLHYFPTFLARSIAVLPEVGQKSFLADILNEELGNGDPSNAHESVFLSTMTRVGFPRDSLWNSAPFEPTKKLVAGYERASSNPLSAIGYVYATEVIDLAMVSGLGDAVREVTGAQSLPWVDIHVSQEPNHTTKVNLAVDDAIDEDAAKKIVRYANDHWVEWDQFFSAIESKVVDRSRPVASFVR